MSTHRRERTALWWAACLGAFGVLSGYTLFATLREAEDHLLQFAVALVVAAGISFGGECLRELVRRGHVFEDAPEPIVLRAISTFLVVFVLEAFIHSWHEGATAPRALLAELAHLVLFHEVEGGSTVPWLIGVIVLMSGVWIGLGALLSWLLAWLIFNEAPDRTAPTDTPVEGRRFEFAGLSAVTGALVGLLVPVVLLVFVLLIRFARSVWQILSDHQAWSANLRTVHESGSIMKVLTAPIYAVDFLLLQSSWPRAIVFAVIGAHVVTGLWRRRRGPALVYGAVLWVVLLPAIAYDVGPLLRLLGAALLLWLIPGVALGLALPYLREPRARHWSIIAAASGVALAGLALMQAGSSSEYLAAGFAFALAAILVFLSVREELSLLLPLVIGLAIYAAALIPATVLGVFNDFAFLSARPVLGGTGLMWGELRALEPAGDIDAVIQTYPALSRAVPGQLGVALARIRRLPGLTYQERGPEIDRLLAELRREPTSVPAAAQDELRHGGVWPTRTRTEILTNDDAAYRARVIRGSLTGAGVAWWAREEWVKNASTALEKAKMRWTAQRPAESVHGNVAPPSLAAKLNASLGGAIGFTVTLALLAAWRIKDGPPILHPGG